jgi:hypothetical protein
MLWQDNRSHGLTPIDAPPALRAFRDPDGPTAFVVHVPPAAVRALREHAPELPVGIEWLRVHTRNRELLRERPAAEDEPAPLRLVLFRDAPDAAAFWALNPPRHLMRKLWSPIDWRRHYEHSACEVTYLPTAPPVLGAALDGVAVEYATRADDGTPVLARIALTPVAMVGDCVFVAAGVTAVVVWVAVLPIAWVVHTVGQEL